MNHRIVDRGHRDADRIVPFSCPLGTVASSLRAWLMKISVLVEEVRGANAVNAGIVGIVGIVDTTAIRERQAQRARPA